MNGRRWMKEEVALLRTYNHLAHPAMHRLLLKHGFERSRGSVISKRRKMGWVERIDRDEMDVGYTALGLSQLLGVEDDTIARWIRLGYIKATREGGDTHGCKFRIAPMALRKFLIEHIHLWNPAKVDKYWMIDVLTAPAC
jgi:hypothetical protein